MSYVGDSSDSNTDYLGTAISKDRYAMTQCGFWSSLRWQRSAHIQATVALAQEQHIANLLQAYNVLVAAGKVGEAERLWGGRIVPLLKL